MQSLIIKEWKLLELHVHITQIGGAHLQCVKKKYIKFELQITQTRHPKSVADGLTE